MVYVHFFRKQSPFLTIQIVVLGGIGEGNELEMTETPTALINEAKGTETVAKME